MQQKFKNNSTIFSACAALFEKLAQNSKPSFTKSIFTNYVKIYRFVRKIHVAYRAIDFCERVFKKIGYFILST